MIKSDKWIRRKAFQEKMIEPFVPNQVRNVNGQKIVSYGLSSYGYDVRCADEFKIFTNINNSIVDPKNFDEKSFVDFKGDVCIIPPNSFALARTVERFKIPRNVLTVCVGKSTYARCFSGDTRVALTDGTRPTFKELVERYENGESVFYGYGFKDGEYVAQRMTAPRKVGTEKTIIVNIDNGKSIECTPDHEFIMRDGSRKKACDLKPKDSLLPLYLHKDNSYERIWNPISRKFKYTHRLAMENYLGRKLCDTEHVHHIDKNTSNNCELNLTVLSSSEHTKLHNLEKDMSKLSSEYWADKEKKQKHLEILHSEESRKKALDSRKKWMQSLEGKMELSERSKKVWENATEERRKKQIEIARSINIREDITRDIVASALIKAGSIRGAARYLGVDRSVFRRFKETVNDFKSGVLWNNHKVVSVTEGNQSVDVYCLTAETGVFALEQGVIVSNCGIIVNVTPFEPEWEGYVTLEFSNTTPLPAKIYAGEGCAQVLFFESDEDCEVSYADRGGKYQGQTGVTLPKA